MATTRSLCQRNPNAAAVAEPLPPNRDENEKMKRIEAKFQVVTPCFLGGANHDEEAELRLPSIKGVLRFWWRALNYSQIAKGATNPNEIIENLREKEGKLFGSSEQGKDQGQSSLIMRLSAESQNLPEIGKNEILRDENRNAVGIGARYLGYGVMNIKGKLERPCLARRKDSFYPFEFTLQIGAKEQKHLEDVLPALKLFGLLGGLGSKSRKGYGSLNLIELKVNSVDTWQKPANENKYVNRLRKLLEPALEYSKEPAISAFYSKSRICLIKFKSKNSAMEVINSYGQAMQEYRKGIKHKNDKAVFGLPLKGVNLIDHEQRRASPLFFHVHKIGGEFVGVALLLRSQFLPESERISANWSMLKGFLNEISAIKIFGRDE